MFFDSDGGEMFLIPMVERCFFDSDGRDMFFDSDGREMFFDSDGREMFFSF